MDPKVKCWVLGIYKALYEMKYTSIPSTGIMIWVVALSWFYRNQKKTAEFPEICSPDQGGSAGHGGLPALAQRMYLNIP